MDLVERMNNVVEYIETHLDSELDHGAFGRLACCSAYEFSRLFSFITGMPVSEYLRRRRLSQAALDIQSGNDKIIDISQKYGYESQSAFSRAFKETHGISPLAARKTGVVLKNYPRISFSLTVRGVNEMNYRIERKDSFKLTGKKCSTDYKHLGEFEEKHYQDFNKGGFFHPPFWYMGAYFLNRDENESCLIGAELAGSGPLEGMDVETIPPSTWAVFPFIFRPGEDAAGETYARAIAEWLPQSDYVRNEDAPFMKVYGHKSGLFEVWIPLEVLP